MEMQNLQKKIITSWLKQTEIEREIITTLTTIVLSCLASLL
jgi:hypothetical protein